MKFLGLVKDSKDLTTKEYVDSADDTLRDSISKNSTALLEKVDKSDIANFTETEISFLWNKYIN